jgi:hypothetical protein
MNQVCAQLLLRSLLLKYYIEAMQLQVIQSQRGAEPASALAFCGWMIPAKRPVRTSAVVRSR